jgi:hypothetical protein
MTQTAQPQLHVSTLRSRRVLGLAALGALLAATIALTLVIVIGSNQNATPIPHAMSETSSFDGGPATGTPSAVAQALGSEPLRGGLSLTTNVPALPRGEAGPANGTPAAVRDAVAAR